MIDKKYFINKSKVIISIGPLSFAGETTIIALILDGFNKFSTYIILICLALTILIVLLNLIKNNYSMISFNERGFTIYNLKSREIVKWENVISCEQLTKKKLQYFKIIAKDINDEPNNEYLVEKTRNIDYFINLYYKNSNDGFCGKKICYINDWGYKYLYFCAILLSVTVLVPMFYIISRRIEIVDNEQVKVLALVILLLNVLIGIVYYIYIRRNRLNVHSDGIDVHYFSENYFIAWENVLEIDSKRYSFDGKEEDYFHIIIDTSRSFECDEIIVAGSFNVLDKIRKHNSREIDCASTRGNFP